MNSNQTDGMGELKVGDKVVRTDGSPMVPTGTKGVVTAIGDEAANDLFVQARWSLKGGSKLWWVRPDSLRKVVRKPRAKSVKTYSVEARELSDRFTTTKGQGWLDIGGFTIHACLYNDHTIDLTIGTPGIGKPVDWCEVVVNRENVKVETHSVADGEGRKTGESVTPTATSPIEDLQKALANASRWIAEAQKDFGIEDDGTLKDLRAVTSDRSDDEA